MFNHKIIKKKLSRSLSIVSSKNHIDELIFKIYLSIINEQRTKFNDLCIVSNNGNIISQLSSKNVKALTFKNLFLEENNSFDLIIILSELNFRDKIEIDLKNIKPILRKKGLLLCSFFSEKNLFNFKNLMNRIEIGFFNGISQRFHPIIDIRDIGNLFNQLGYNNTVIQKENFQYQYDSLEQFIIHMRKMAFTNALLTRSNRHLNKKFYLELKKEFIKTLNGNINFEILISCSWKDN